MKVRFSETVYKDAILSDEEARRVAIKVLLKEFNIPKGAWVSDEQDGECKLMYTVEYSGGSHSWDERKIFRTATRQDGIVCEIIGLLRTIKG